MPLYTGPQIGLGTTLGYKLTSGGSYLPVANLLTIGTSPTVGEVELPLLNLTAKDFLPTLLEAGEVEATMAMNTADPAYIEFAALMATPATIFLIITFADLGTLAFIGFVKGLPISGVEQESLVEAGVTIRIRGTPTWTAHS